ncbi:MAG: hypothetical protein J6T72_05240 [Alphaproteobacteria bacterium]|nr:hypothetical protein [Alphaproteobacteria bacterium]
MEKVLTPFDVGFELVAEPKLEPNLYNVGGNKCKTCPIQESCLLWRRHYESMCFEGLHKALTQTDVCRKVLEKEPTTNEEGALHLYIDSMLYHLDNLTDAKTVPLDLFALWNLRIDCAWDEGCGGELNQKHAVICRFFGRLAVDTLRARGYEI